MKDKLVNILNRLLPTPANEGSEAALVAPYIYLSIWIGIGINVVLVFLELYHIFRRFSEGSADSFQTLIGIDIFINIAISIALYSLLIFFQKGGFLRAFRFAVILGAVVVVGNEIYGGAGIYGATLTFCFVILIAAAAFLGRKYLNLSGMVVICGITTAFLAQRFNLIESDFPTPSLFHLFLYLMAITLAILFLHITLVRLVERTDQLSQQSDNLKQTTEELNLYKNHLEDIVSQRTTELKQALVAAQESNKIKNQFVANMSHELRTPLNAIIGYSEMIFEDSEDIDDRPISADAQRIRMAGRHLLTLVNNVLDFSKIEAGQLGVKIESFDLHALIDDVALMTKPVFEKNGNQFNWKRSLDKPIVTSDPTMIRQILINLLNNAAQFTREGKVWLDLHFSKENFEILVQDTGIGIDDQQLETIFLPFQQVDNSIARRYDGSGLGLAITKHLCQTLGGDITVESELHKGSTFRVSLPIHVEPRLKAI